MLRERAAASERRLDFAWACGKDLIDAIACGDVSKAQGLVLAGADVNGCKTFSGSSALHVAASLSSAGLCRLLISHAADVNAPDGHLWTVLHMAAQQGQSVLILQLLQAHAVVDVLNLDGESPLTLAAGSGHLETMKLLLKASASPDAVAVEGLDGVDFHPVAPLHRAVERNVSPNAIAKLIFMGARVDCLDHRRNQPLHAASHNGSAQIIRLLLDGLADPNARNANQRTPLHLASASGAGRAVKMLVQHSADLEASDSNNLTPIQVAKDRLMEMQLRELGAISGSGGTGMHSTSGGHLTMELPHRWATPTLRSPLPPLAHLSRQSSGLSLHSPKSPGPPPKSRSGRRTNSSGVAALIVGCPSPPHSAGSPKAGLSGTARSALLAPPSDWGMSSMTSLGSVKSLA